MKKIDIIILGLILFIALAFRVYKIDNPLSERYSWPQADTAIQAKQLVQNDTRLGQQLTDEEFFLPLRDNPFGYRFTELPVYESIVGNLYRYLPITSIDIYGRIVTIGFSLLLIICLYYLAIHEHSRIAAVSASLMYAIFPFFVFLSRLVLSDTTAVAITFVALVLLYKYMHQKKRNIILFIFSVIIYAIAVLIKPTMLFYSFAFLYLLIITFKFDVFKKWELYAYILGVLIPIVAWRIYLLQYYDVLASNRYLLNYIRQNGQDEHVYFQLSFIKTFFMERMGITMMGIYMIGIFFIGLIGKHKNYFFHSILFSGLVYVLTFQAGNLQYEYFQTLILPAIALIIGMGIGHIFYGTKNHINPFFAYPLVFLFISLAWSFSFLQIKGYYEYNGKLTQIAKLINSFTNPEDKIVTDTEGDTTLLFLSDRKGTPFKNKSVTEYKNAGYTYFVTSNKNDIQQLRDQGYQVLVENNQFSLIRL